MVRYATIKCERAWATQTVTNRVEGNKFLPNASAIFVAIFPIFNLVDVGFLVNFNRWYIASDCQIYCNELNVTYIV